MKNKHFNFFCKISGRVKGVGFRAWTKKNAKKYFLTGWVKNCEDKTVECELSGSKKNFTLFLKDCLRGPILSSVKDIKTHEKPFERFKSFTIYY